MSYRYIIVKALFFIYLLSALEIAMASSNVNSYFASELAHSLTQVHSTENLVGVLGLNKRDSLALQEDLAKVKSSKNIHVLVEMPNESIVKFSLNKGIPIIIDFTSFSAGLVLVNKKEIQLKSTKSYLNYRLEIFQALHFKETKNASLLKVLINQAYADSFVASMLDATTAAGFVTKIGEWYEELKIEHYSRDHVSQLKEDIPLPLLAEVIKKTYQKESVVLQAGAATEKSQLPTTLAFTCKAGRLENVNEVTLHGEDDQERLKKSPLLRFYPDKGYEIEVQEQCKSEANLEGLVQKRTTKKVEREIHSLRQDIHQHSLNFMCPYEKINIFKSSRFFRFPLLADQCCQQKGCAESAEQTLRDIKNKKVN